MVRPIVKKDQKKCLECGTDMKPVKFKRPFAKLCPECKGDRVQGNHELREIYKNLQKGVEVPELKEGDMLMIYVKFLLRTVYKNQN